MDQEIVKLLWTGGWDSTFRLLEVIILQERKLQPYYIIDSNRVSAGFELRAMQRVKKQLFKEYPKAKNILLPTRYYELSSIPHNESINERFNRILKEVPLGDQYKWLAYFASSQNLEKLELSSHPSIGYANTYLQKYIHQFEINGGFNFEIDMKHEGTDVYEVFKFYRFPVFTRPKTEMHKIAMEIGFDHLLKHTWFCHHPRAKGIPCGVCIPCVVTMQDGLKNRFPYSSRVRYYLRAFLNREQFKEKFPILYCFIGRIKRILIPGNNK